MTRSRLARFVGGVAVAAIVLAACGGPSSNGEAAKGAQQIVTDAKKATASAKSVQVTGSGTVSGSSLVVNVRAGRGRGGGSISTSGAVLNLVLDEKSIYIKADAATLQELTGSASVAKSRANEWLETTTTGTSTNQSIGSVFSSLLDITKLPGSFTFGGVPTKQPITKFDGQSVIPILDPQSGGTLYVASTGKPYIIAIKGSKTSGGTTISFTDYGKAKIPAAPPNAVPLGSS